MTLIIQELTDDNTYEEIGRVEDGRVSNEVLLGIYPEEVWQERSEQWLAERIDGPYVMAGIVAEGKTETNDDDPVDKQTATTDDEWVQDPSEDAEQMRWRNTRTGEYRYQPTQPGATRETGEGGDEASDRSDDNEQHVSVASAREAFAEKLATMGSAVDFSNNESFENHHGDTYPRLKTNDAVELRSQINDLINGWENHESYAESGMRSPASDVWNVMRGWKQNSVGLDREKAEKWAQHAFGIEANTYETQRDPRINPYAVRAFALYTAASQEWWRQEFGEGKSVWRGPQGTGAGSLFLSWLADPQADEFAIKETTISNFATSRELASSHGHADLLIEREIDPEDVLNAQDHIRGYYKGTAGGGEGEVWLAGGEYEVPADNIRLDRDFDSTTGEWSETTFADLDKPIAELDKHELYLFSSFFRTTLLQDPDRFEAQLPLDGAAADNYWAFVDRAEAVYGDEWDGWVARMREWGDEHVTDRRVEASTAPPVSFMGRDDLNWLNRPSEDDETDDSVDKQGDEWVRDPSSEAEQTRWRNTRTGEYRYQETQPGAADSVAEHSIRAVERSEPDPTIRLAALLHKIGKPEAREVAEDGRVQFPNHETVSSEVAGEILERLHYPNDTIDAVTTLIEHHTAVTGPDMSDHALRSLAATVGEDNLADVIQLRQADLRARGQAQTATAVGDLIDRYAELDDAGQGVPDEITIDGHEVLDMGVERGPEVGVVLDHLYEWVLADPDRNDPEALRDEARRFIDANDIAKLATEWVGDDVGKQDDTQVNYPVREIAFRDSEGEQHGGLLARVADTPAKRERGLADEGGIADGEAMLFDYDGVERRTITMAPLDFPIDIIFADATGEITAIEHAQPDHPDVSAPAKWVVEAPHGYCEQCGIDVGHRLELPSTALRKKWVPYVGPRQGEGWQSTRDPDDVRYQEEPPGEVAAGYSEDHWADDGGAEYDHYTIEGDAERAEPHLREILTSGELDSGNVEVDMAPADPALAERWDLGGEMAMAEHPGSYGLAATTVQMSPDDFAEVQEYIATEVDQSQFGADTADSFWRGVTDARLDSIKEGLRGENVKEFYDGVPAPYIIIGADGTLRAKQEGRHRAVAAQQMGLDSMPVRVIYNPVKEGAGLGDGGGTDADESDLGYVSHEGGASLNVSTASHAESLHEAGASAGASSRHMHVATWTDESGEVSHRAFVTDYGPNFRRDEQGEKPYLGERAIAADQFLRNLGFGDHLPKHFLNREDRYLAVEGIPGREIRDAPGTWTDQIDRESMKDFAAAVIIAGNSDLHPKNVLVDETGQFYAVDVDKSGGDFEHGPARFRERGVTSIRSSLRAAGIHLSRSELQERCEDLARRITVEDATANVPNSQWSDKDRHQFRENIRANIDGFRNERIQL